MNAQNSGSTAQIPSTLGIYALGGAEESSIAAAARDFAEVRAKKVWRDAYSLAVQYLDDEQRLAVTEKVLAILVGQVGMDGWRFGAFRTMEGLANSLNRMLSKADGPFFSGSEKWHTDGDESYTRLTLSWDEFWQFPSHEDDILHDLGVAGQIVLTLLATCPRDLDDLFCRPHLCCEREGSNIFGEEPEQGPVYGTLDFPAVEAWIAEVLR